MHTTRLLNFSGTSGIRPYMIDGGDFTYCYRKRLCWGNWIMFTFRFCEGHRQRSLFSCEVTVSEPSSFSWFSGSIFRVWFHLLPTLSRILLSEKLMKKPAGIFGASEVVLDFLAKLLAKGLVTFWSTSFVCMQLKYHRLLDSFARPLTTRFIMFGRMSSLFLLDICL